MNVENSEFFPMCLGLYLTVCGFVCTCAHKFAFMDWWNIGIC